MINIVEIYFMFMIIIVESALKYIFSYHVVVVHVKGMQGYLL